MGIADVVRELLNDDKSKTQKELGHLAKVEPATVCNWLKGVGKVPADAVIPWSEYFGVHPMFLLTGEEQPEAPVAEVPAGSVQLDEAELALFEWVRQLDYEGRVKVSAAAIDELRRMQQENEIDAPSVNEGRAG